MQNGIKVPLSLMQPVNKAMPDDKERQEDCRELVKRLKREKKEREEKMAEY